MQPLVNGWPESRSGWILGCIGSGTPLRRQGSVVRACLWPEHGMTGPFLFSARLLSGPAVASANATASRAQL